MSVHTNAIHQRAKTAAAEMLLAANKAEQALLEALATDIKPVVAEATARLAQQLRYLVSTDQMHTFVPGHALEWNKKIFEAYSSTQPPGAAGPAYIAVRDFTNAFEAAVALHNAAHIVELRP